MPQYYEIKRTHNPERVNFCSSQSCQLCNNACCENAKIEHCVYLLRFTCSNHSGMLWGPFLIFLDCQEKIFIEIGH